MTLRSLNTKSLQPPAHAFSQAQTCCPHNHTHGFPFCSIWRASSFLSNDKHNFQFPTRPTRRSHDAAARFVNWPGVGLSEREMGFEHGRPKQGSAFHNMGDLWFNQIPENLRAQLTAPSEDARRCRDRNCGLAFLNLTGDRVVVQVGKGRGDIARGVLPMSSRDVTSGEVSPAAVEAPKVYSRVMRARAAQNSIGDIHCSWWEAAKLVNGVVAEGTGMGGAH